MEKKPKNFIAAVEDDQIEHIELVVERLKEKGCEIRQVLTFSGIISGCSSGKEANLQELKVNGIKHIEEDREVRAI
ncbi:MAG: hypothetical protein WD431_20020 [Cyclobacteriaceae bacterium]